MTNRTSLGGENRFVEHGNATGLKPGETGMTNRGIITILAASIALGAMVGPAGAEPLGKIIKGATGNAIEGVAKNAPDVNIKPRQFVPDVNGGALTPNIAQPNIKAPVTQPNAMGKLPANSNLLPSTPKVAVTQPNAMGKLPADPNARPKLTYDSSLPGNPDRPLPKTPLDAVDDAPPSYTGLATRNQDKLDDLFEVRQQGINPDNLNLNRNVGRAPAGNDALAGANRNNPLKPGESAGFPGYKAGPEEPRWNGIGNPYGNGQQNLLGAVAPMRDNVPAPKLTPRQIAKKAVKYGVGSVVVVGAAAGAGYGLAVGTPALIEWAENRN